jgi:hypothetical protein
MPSHNSSKLPSSLKQASWLALTCLTFAASTNALSMPAVPVPTHVDRPGLAPKLEGITDGVIDQTGAIIKGTAGFFVHPIDSSIHGLQAVQHPLISGGAVVHEIHDAFVNDPYHAAGASLVNAAAFGRILLN